MMSRPVKWSFAVLLVLLLALLAYVIAGPWLALRGLDQAVARQQYDRFDRYVDFRALRVNLKARIEDRLARAYGGQRSDNPLASAALMLADQSSGKLVDAMVTPAGIAILLEGNVLINRVSDPLQAPRGNVPPAQRTSPLTDAKAGYQSPSRFTAVVHNRNQQPVAFVFSRSGLHWKLTDIELPQDLP